MFGIGAGELVMILVAGLIIFGPSELPKIGRAVGKGLREFRKAQAAFTATLDEVSAEPKKEVGKRNEELEIKQKNDSSLQTPNSSLAEVPAIENISADETPPHSALTVDEHPVDAKESQAKENSAPRPKSLTVDDVITLAKQSPLNKEDLNEKNLNGTAGNNTPADASASNVTARSNTDSTDKQSKSAEN